MISGLIIKLSTINIKSFTSKIKWDFTRTVTLFAALITLLPVGLVTLSFLFPADEIWEHLRSTILYEVIFNTIILVLGVGAGTLLIGVSLAWLTAIYDFPGRKFFSWTLMLPLAIPAYVTAFVAIGIFDYTGVIQTALRPYFNNELFWFPKIKSTGGVILIMTLALYPYVYLLARNAFISQGKRALEVSQSLGYSRKKAFIKAALPMARPWIIGGLLLVIMETLADFGAVYLFNYDTLTTLIYKAWFGFFSLTAASQIASILILFVFMVMLGEQYSRKRMRFYSAGKNESERVLIKLKGIKAAAAFLFSAFTLFIAFILPTLQLFNWSYINISDGFNIRFISLLTNSLTLGILASIITLLLAVVIAYSNRFHKDFINQITVRTATLGYALPGAVLAVGIFSPFVWFDNQIIFFFKNNFDINIGFIFNGTLITLIVAYVVRFLAVGYNSIETSMQRITPSIDESARSLGLGKYELLKKIHLPLIKKGMAAAVILVFVDVMKEMPITLMMRPFGWDTLAVRIFEMTSEGEWQKAALPALTIILAGLLPVRILMKHSEKNK